MGKIYYIMGKSSSGKDTIFKELIQKIPGIRTVTLYTTRPVREGEQNGVEYYFVGEEELEQYVLSGKVIEMRTYNTVHGPWKYATIDDGQILLSDADYLMIGTLESYEKMCAYYGRENMVPLYIEVEDGERLFRAVKREQKQKEPKYAEVCRRFLADTEDFSEENLRKAGITKRYNNEDRLQCIEKIIEEVRHDKF